LKELGKPVILGGDLNVAHQEIDVFDAHKKRNKAAGFTDAERNSFSKFLRAGFVDTYRHFHGNKVAYSYWN
jgi:exodeoxyribonuclease-3